MALIATVYQVGGIKGTRQAYASSTREVEIRQKQEEGLAFSRGMISYT